VTALRVSLHSTLKREVVGSAAAAPVLDPAGPHVSLGCAATFALAIPVQPSPQTLFGPRGACFAGRALWVSDTGHHRLLGWAQAPASDDTPADWVIGQADFFREGRNSKSEPGAATLNVPTGVCACGEGLAVADAWNHRVLIWHRRPTASHVPADVVLGHPDFASNAANRGADAPTASTLFWPYGVFWDGARLWVSDTGNRRVLMWDALPTANGAAADLVLGQKGFATRDENGGTTPNASSLRWPHAIASWRGRLCVADAGNNRILVWNQVPLRNDVPSDHVLGQPDATSVDHNQSRYWPDAGTVNMPYGVTVQGDWLLAADTANSRLLAWHLDDCATGRPARRVTGQADFGAKGDNRWRTASRDSLCWPYAVVAADDGSAVVSDSGNNRVLLWPAAIETGAT
jgi:hypothetical protein